MTTATAGYPVRVHARLDPDLSRWLWLVKWFLAIPHYLVLAFLWLGFVAVSVVVFFAIPHTGRYPKGLFDLVLGMNRWALRVAACAALMTDDYPPFRFDAGGDEPGTESFATTTN